MSLKINWVFVLKVFIFFSLISNLFIGIISFLLTYILTIDFLSIFLSYNLVFIFFLMNNVINLKSSEIMINSNLSFWWSILTVFKHLLLIIPFLFLFLFKTIFSWQMMILGVFLIQSSWILFNWKYHGLIYKKSV